MSPATREALEKRAARTFEGAPQLLTTAEFQTLTAFAAIILPQNDREKPIDLAGALDAYKAEGGGNGWRYAELPPDADALRTGLQLLDQSAKTLGADSFAELSTDEATALLKRVQSETDLWSEFPAPFWFEDVSGDLVQIYMAHPTTLAEIGFTGMADVDGWDDVGLNNRQSWEPEGRPQ